MLTRRIAVGACALCLAIPAAAGASEGTNPPNGKHAEGTPSTIKAKGPYGIRPTGPPSTVQAKGPYGVPPTGPRSTVTVKGPYGTAPTDARSAVTAKGPYGIPATGPPSTVKDNGPVSGTPLRDDTEGWRTAAISEAALLAALLLGLALVLPARRRAAHTVT
jgi:hypothetical protein